jgi:hypothetical protein
VPNLLSAEQKAARVQIPCDLHNNLLFEREKNFATIITGDKSWCYWSYAELLMWAQTRDDLPPRPLQKINSTKSIVTMFFSSENLAFLGSLPKGQNMDSDYFCNTLLEGVKTGAFAGT